MINGKEGKRTNYLDLKWGDQPLANVGSEFLTHINTH